MKLNLNEVLTRCLPPVIVKYSYRFYRVIADRLAAQKLKHYSCLHLACGTNLLQGWANVDFNGTKQIISLDLTRPLPVQSDSMRFIFNEHFIEHLTIAQGEFFLKECYRVLKSDGVLRISTPDLRAGIDLYLCGKIDHFVDRGWRPKTPCQMINEGMRIWGHQFIYDSAEIKKTLTEAGFSHISAVPWRQSASPELCGLECRPFNGEIILEARK
jgi:predicted SAM-dependent methyltransferase